MAEDMGVHKLSDILPLYINIQSEIKWKSYVCFLYASLEGLDDIILVCDLINGIGSVFFNPWNESSGCSNFWFWKPLRSNGRHLVTHHIHIALRVRHKTHWKKEKGLQLKIKLALHYR
jgi:hypothetical protein